MLLQLQFKFKRFHNSIYLTVSSTPLYDFRVYVTLNVTRGIPLIPFGFLCYAWWSMLVMKGTQPKQNTVRLYLIIY